MKVEIQSKKFVKPSIPTPPNLGKYKISLLDELSSEMYVPLILYYPENDNNDKYFLSSAYDQLEKSLGQTLVKFYPLAGRYIKEFRVIDCKDQGVLFVEAKVDCHLQEILSQRAQNLDPEILNHFIPTDIGTYDESTDPLLLAIQVTMFECGGWALGICFSHKIADANTLSIFIQEWATANQKQYEDIQFQKICPSFNSPSFFLARGLPEFSLEELRTKNKIVTKRLLFDKNAISTLRANSRANGTSKPTSRVQLVNAIIWKALVGVESLKVEKSRANLIIQPVNLRGKTTLPLPQNYCGNLFTLARVQLMAGENMDVQGLADQLSNSIRESLEEWAHVMTLNEDDPIIKNLVSSLVNYYMISCWSGFPFYEADFGWGKPVWISSVNMHVKNWIYLMDDKEGDGIEAWVNLDWKDMLIFQQDCDIQALTN